MALAGRFMTKCVMMLGIVTNVAAGRGAEVGKVRDRFVEEVTTVLVPVRAKFKTSDAAWRMNVWPSSQKGRT
jgi:hypothetical protein